MAEPLDLFSQSISISHTVKHHLTKFENGRISDAKSVLRTKSFFLSNFISPFGINMLEGVSKLTNHFESLTVYEASGFLEAFGAEVKSGLIL
jgi:hypothetical protein